MKELIIIISFNVLCLAMYGQSQPVKLDGVTPETEKYWNSWYKDLFDIGIKMNKDSLLIGDETKKLLQDEATRKLVYPETYTWQETVRLLEKLEFKKAFWYLLNLYETDTARRQLVLESIVAYEKIMETDKILVSSFYTYAMLDPRVADLKNGKIRIERPDLLDRRFALLKQMTNHIITYRKSQKK